MQHFLVNVDLPSTCEVLGHVMMPGGEGCYYCDDILKVPVHWWSGDYSLMTIVDSNSRGKPWNKYGGDFVDVDGDKRIIEVVHDKQSSYRECWGYILIDPHVEFKPNRYSHKHDTITAIIKNHIDSGLTPPHI